MKKTICFFMALALLLSLAGCNKPKTDLSEKPFENTKEETMAESGSSESPQGEQAASESADEETPQPEPGFQLVRVVVTGRLDSWLGFDLHDALSWGLVEGTMQWTDDEGEGTLTYDELGRLLTVTWDGERMGQGHFTATAQHTYDANSRLVSFIYSEEGISNIVRELHWDYDERGSLLRYEEKYTNSDYGIMDDNISRYTYEYDQRGNILKQTWDRETSQIKTSGPNYVQQPTQTYVYTYDEEGRKLTEVRYIGESENPDRTFSWTYDANDHVIKAIEETSLEYYETDSAYNEFGKRASYSKKTYYFGTLKESVEEEYTYNEYGDIIEETSVKWEKGEENRKEQRYYWEYDQEGRKITYYKGNGTREQYEYDQDGNQTRTLTLNANDKKATESICSYYPNGEKKEVQDIKYNTEYASDEIISSVRTQYYDEYGNLLKYTVSDGDQYFEIVYEYEQF